MSRSFFGTLPPSSRTIIAAVLVASYAAPAWAVVTPIGPLIYRKASDSPFLANPALTTTIEDFEDGVLNLPGLINLVPFPFTIPPYGPAGVGDGIGIVISPGPETDSVDGDDGAIDGSGIGGHSLRTARFGPVLNGTYDSAIVFDLLPDSQGRYPVACGFVWTDGEMNSRVVMTIHEVGANSSGGWGYPGIVVGDAVLTGTTAEDRFFGITSTIGMDRLMIESIYIGFEARVPNIELDHLQIAYAAVPEPSSISALIAGGVCLAVARRRSRAADE